MENKPFSCVELGLFDAYLLFAVREPFAKNAGW